MNFKDKDEMLAYYNEIIESKPKPIIIIEKKFPEKQEGDEWLTLTELSKILGCSKSLLTTYSCRYDMSHLFKNINLRLIGKWVGGKGISKVTLSSCIPEIENILKQHIKKEKKVAYANS